MAIKNIIFDWSGVLSNDFMAVYNAVMGVFEDVGLQKISPKEFRDQLTLPYIDFYKRYNPNISLDVLKEAFLRNFANHEPPPLFNGAKEALEKLKENGI
ncbi:MAG: HAD family hydrolase, partial [Candidatus Micrarchaeota archaeon]|nr:HAD family hydrolase [Candidatus Micrarchaeota archaeon]